MIHYAQNITSSPRHHHRHHNDVIKWHFPRYWPFVKGIHQSPVDSPHKGQWRQTLMFSLMCAWTNDLANNRDAGDLRRHRHLRHCNDAELFESITHTNFWHVYPVKCISQKRRLLSLYFLQKFWARDLTSYVRNRGLQNNVKQHIWRRFV